MKRLVVITEIIAPYRIPVFNALARRAGIDLHVIFLARTDASMRQWLVYESEIEFSYKVLSGWRRRVGKYNVLLNYNLPRSLHEARPDVIVCGGYNYLASWQALTWSKRNKVPFLLWSESTARDQRGQHFLVELLKKKFFENCDAFVVPGESAAEYLRELGVCAKKIFYAHNAVDIDLFSALGERTHKRPEQFRAQFALPARYFLFVGRLLQSKGVMDLLQAYASLPPELRSEVGLVFAGNGPMRAELEASAREIFPGQVHFPGFVHRDELATYYSLAECLVFPTHSDPWGLVVNEAMACGLPVICTDVAGCAADLIQKNGRLVPPKDVPQLAKAMSEMATNHELRTRMSRESEILIRSYSPERCAAGIAEASLAMEAHV